MSKSRNNSLVESEACHVGAEGQVSGQCAAKAVSLLTHSGGLAGSRRDLEKKQQFEVLQHRVWCGMRSRGHN